jgi:hypothetical protein
MPRLTFGAVNYRTVRAGASIRGHPAIGVFSRRGERNVGRAKGLGILSSCRGSPVQDGSVHAVAATGRNSSLPRDMVNGDGSLDAGLLGVLRTAQT